MAGLSGCGTPSDEAATPRRASVLEPPHTSESERHAELPFKEFGFASQLTKIDLSLRRRDHAYDDGAALNLHIQTAHGLGGTRVQSHGDAQQSGQLANACAIRLRERAIKTVAGCGRGIGMIAHKAGHYGLLMFAQAGNISMAHEIFAMFMMSARIHRKAHIVQERSQFERDSLRGGKFVNRRQLIEKLRCQPPHMFTMTGVGVHSRGEAARLQP